MSNVAAGRPKPWERRHLVEVDANPVSTPKPWESSSTSPVETVVPESSNGGTAQHPGSRPWEVATTNAGVSGYGGYNNVGYGTGGGYGGYNNVGYGTGGGYGGYNSLGYGTGGGYGGYNSLGYGTGGGYGGYNSLGYGGSNSMGYGGAYGVGSGMYGRPMYGMYGQQPFGTNGMEPNGMPASIWQTMLGSIGGIVHFFGRLTFIVDENAHAVHFFISALMQLLDRMGSLYLYVLRLLGWRRGKS
jgi:peroxin-13